ncbi:MAG TPA: SIMPL domain-containing protein [Terracidiphilus sp.]|nr:SIMPL domain-containing protein [Terracidiphilus sp.]
MMRHARVFLCLYGGFALATAATAQQVAPPQLVISAANRTLAVTAQDNVSVEPEIAVLHVGFDTQPEDAKAAYADGARTSNTIIAAIKAEGITESAIRSESQYLTRDWKQQHKFKLTQQWTVRVPAERAAEVLDAAITAGATSSGEIEWTVKDERALETQALEKAAARARQNAETLARGMGVKLGAVVYTSNEVSGGVMPRVRMMSAMSAAKTADQAQALAIEPQKVTRDATVYTVFAIE